MTVPFAQIPANLRTTLFFAELDNSGANLGSTPSRSLLISQMAAGGTLTPNVPVILEGVSAARTGCGAGSMGHLLAQQYRARDSFGETWLLPVADDSQAAAAVGTTTITAAPSASGVLPYYVAGQLVSLAVSSTQTPAQIATALAAAINANASLPVTATATGAVVTETAKNKGLAGNDIDRRVAYLGAAGGESMPTGMVVNIVPMSGGLLNPSLNTGLANLGDTLFDYIAMPYTDTASLNALQAFLADRWSWDQMLYGGAFSAMRGTLGTLTTFGAGRNDPHISVMGFNDSPTPAWLWAADICAAAAQSLRADPATPLQTLALNVLAPPVQSRFAIADRNALLWTGIATYTVQDDGTVQIERPITTYQKNAYGDADDSLLDTERLYTIAYVIRDLKSFITSTYGRFKLADDGTTFRPGANIVTPSILKAALIGRHRQLEKQGITQNTDAFAAALQVERNSSNRCRVDGLLPIVPIDQLRTFAALIRPTNSAQLGS